jgi:hypothetical protein
MRHSKYAPSRFVEECRPALLSFAEGSETSCAMRSRKKKAALSAVWDAALGITAVARAIPNQSDRVEFEGIAGKLLDKVAA